MSQGEYFVDRDPDQGRALIKVLVPRLNGTQGTELMRLLQLEWKQKTPWVILDVSPVTAGMDSWTMGRIYGFAQTMKETDRRFEVRGISPFVRECLDTLQMSWE